MIKPHSILKSVHGEPQFLPVPPRVKNLTGKVFGKLTVLGFVGLVPFNFPNHIGTWLTECSCLNRTRKIFDTNRLNQGTATSCVECPNEIQMRGKITIIKLLRRDGTLHKCFIDTKDYPLVKNYRWCVETSKKGNAYYAVTEVRKSGIRLKMHRLICPNPKGQVEHKNLNGLDNRRTNLRPSTQAQNCANKKLYRNNSSGYKGIYQNRSGSWGARIVFTEDGEQRTIRLGSYGTKIKAALAYDRGAKKYHGEFAFLNFPPKRPKGFTLKKKRGQLADKLRGLR